EGDPAADRDGVADRVRPGDRDGTGVRPDEGGEDVDQRRLAGAVRPEQRMDHAGVDGEVHPGEDLQGSEGLPYAADEDRRVHGDLPSQWCVWRKQWMAYTEVSTPYAVRLGEWTRSPRTCRCHVAWHWRGAWPPTPSVVPSAS